MIRKMTLFLLVITMIVSMTACNKRKETVSADKNKDTAIPVSITSVNKGSISIKQSYSSKTVADDEAMIFPVVQGMIDEVFIEVGDEVKKDDVLFTINRTDLLNQLKEANKSLEKLNVSISMQQSSLEATKGSMHQQKLAGLEQMLTSAEIAYNTAKETYEDIQVLYEGKAVSELELNKADDGFKQAEAAYNLAKFNYDLYVDELSDLDISVSEKQLQQTLLQKEQIQISIETLKDTIKDTKVKSPINGIITSVNVKEKQSINQNQVPVTVVNSDIINVDVDVSENLVKKLQVDQEVEVSISAAADEHFVGIIKYISIAADKKTSKFRVRIQIDNSEGEIYAGMFAQVSLLSNFQEGLIIPLDAIQTDRNGQYIYTLNEGVLEKKYVIVGINDGNKVVITDGLIEGDVLIIKGQHYIEEYSTVKVVE